jgi:16S rRNA (adenine1518-N6/adenine1519-N6)-dimethyltransferase
MKDLSQIDQLKSHLQKHGLFAQKSFGQNFLINSGILDRIVESAELDDDTRVVEVGPGPGVLSQRLAPRVEQLVAVEIDQKMVQPWKDLMADFKNAEIINLDVLKYFPEDAPYKLVANIPYYITSPILKHFLREQKVRRPELIVLMIQKEVAERICDLKHPTLLSWEIRLFGVPEIVCPVPPSAFYPSPKVDSAVLKIRVLPEPLIRLDQMDAFFQMLAWSYKQPRKTLYNNLSSVSKWSKEELLEILQKAGVEPGLRPHQLDLEQWKALMSCL